MFPPEEACRLQGSLWDHILLRRSKTFYLARSVPGNSESKQLKSFRKSLKLTRWTRPLPPHVYIRTAERLTANPTTWKRQGPTCLVTCRLGTAYWASSSQDPSITHAAVGCGDDATVFESFLLLQVIPIELTGSSRCTLVVSSFELSIDPIWDEYKPVHFHRNSVTQQPCGLWKVVLAGRLRFHPSQ